MKPLRVVAGTARGLHLRSVPGDKTRPITDRAKESLFNVLRPHLMDATFLDLFAGTGAVGIEALSQGAGFVRFLDNQKAAIDTINANLSSTKLAPDAQVLQGDSFAHLSSHPDRAFDFIFIAPPQYHGLWKRALIAIDAQPGWLVEDGWVVIQIDPTEYEKLTLQNLEEFDQRKYGNVLLVLFEKKALE